MIQSLLENPESNHVISCHNFPSHGTHLPVVRPSTLGDGEVELHLPGTTNPHNMCGLNHGIWHLVMCLKIELLQKPMEKRGKNKRKRTKVISVQFPTSKVSLLTESGVLSQELGQLDLCFLEGLCLWTISCPLTDASLGFTMLNVKPSLAELVYLTIDLTRSLFGE